MSTNNQSIQGMRFERDGRQSSDVALLSFEVERNSKDPVGDEVFGIRDEGLDALHSPKPNPQCRNPLDRLRVDRERMSGAKSRLEPQRRG